MSKVAIIILNWNRYDDTRECLESIKKLNTKNIEIAPIIVDNASNLDELKKLENYALANDFILLKNSKNLGFAEGNNIGIQYALKNKADYVLILNNDTEVDKNLILELINAAKKDTKIGIVTPKIYFAKGYEFQKGYKKKDLGKVIWSAGGRIDWNNIYGTNTGVDEVDHGQYDKFEDTDFATGAAMFLTKEVLKKVRGFDERYFMYLEDLELSVRAKKRGYRVVYEPKAILWHKVARSSGVGSGLNDYFITRNRLVFAKKYAKLRTKIAVLKEGLKFIITGRPWQRLGALDYLTGNLYKGSWR